LLPVRVRLVPSHVAMQIHALLPRLAITYIWRLFWGAFGVALQLRARVQFRAFSVSMSCVNLSFEFLRNEF
jgi:hypothetical protein